jgi:hypothetical protein
LHSGAILRIHRSTVFSCFPVTAAIIPTPHMYTDWGMPDHDPSACVLVFLDHLFIIVLVVKVKNE